MAIYHIMDWENTDGPRFVRLASRLPLYAGAVQGRIKLDNSIEDTSPRESDTPGESFSMREIASGANRFDALNNESERAGGGRLFEVVTN